MNANKTPPFSNASDYRKTHWRLANAFTRHAIPEALRPWLLDQGSLTQRLIEHCPGPFQVKVQSQGYGFARFNERRSLGMRDKNYCLIRQVLLVCDQTPMVFARTVVPLSTLSGRERRLSAMGSRSLGAALFADPTMRRDQLEIAKIGKDDYFYEQACQTLATKPAKIWGRRSVFYLNFKKLLVSEFFLPTIASCKGYGQEPKTS